MHWRRRLQLPSDRKRPLNHDNKPLPDKSPERIIAKPTGEHG